MNSPNRSPVLSLVIRISIILAAGLLLGVWLFYTPPGLLGKADAIGYAVCHQIPERSFFIGERQAPLCARCTGMYTGALIGIVYQIPLGKRGKLPALKFLIPLGLLFIAFAVDGGNSFLSLLKQNTPLEAIRNLPTLYQPHNWSRLVTGLGVGLGMSVLLLPIFHQTIWEDWKNEPLLSSWRQLIEITLISFAGIVAVLSENPLLLYPIVILSSITVLLILSMVYTILWTMILKRENQAQNWKDIVLAGTLGFFMGLLQIALMDMGRFWFTGSWSGFFS